MSKEHILYQYVNNDKIVEYINQLILAIPSLHLKIDHPRTTKLGHMKHDKRNNTFVISLNNNLSPTKFFYVFLHEYAHLLVAQKHKTYKPHGYEWQLDFFKLLQDAIQKNFFNASVAQSIIQEFFMDGVFSRQRDFNISRTIDQADQIQPSLYIKDISIGTTFMLKNGMQFVLLEKKRTRFLCKEIHSNKKYLISSYAIVDKVIKKI